MPPAIETAALPFDRRQDFKRERMGAEDFFFDAAARAKKHHVRPRMTPAQFGSERQTGEQMSAGAAGGDGDG